MDGRPKVTVYITSYNYADYVEKAVESVLNQTLQDFELLIFNDGSTDNTEEVLKKYEANPKITVINQQNKGMPKTCNEAIRKAKGEYIVRLDADDYFDENMLFVLANVLDSKPELGMVYPDYYEIDDCGEIIGIVRRKKIGQESKLLDLPAHGACTMVRRQYLLDLGCYSEDIKCQDGYDLWIRFIQKYNPYNANLPLFYYRKHSRSMTATSKKILQARKYIKEKFVKNKEEMPESCIIIPIRRQSNVYEDLPLKKINGKYLADYVIDAAMQSKASKVVVTTEDEEIAEIFRNKGVHVVMRPQELASFKMPIEPTIKYVLSKLIEENFVPSIIGVLFYTSPLINKAHIDEAINTLAIYDSDSVVGVRENMRLHYIHGEDGLEPLFKDRKIKQEREHLYEESGAMVFSRSSVLEGDKLVGKRISHIVLTEDESIDIEDKYSYWLAEKILTEKETLEQLDNKKITRGY